MTAPINFIAYDLLNHVYRAQIRFDTVSFGQTLSSPASFDATLPAGLPEAAANVLDPGRTIIYASQGQIIASAIVWRRSFANGKLRIGGNGWFSYFTDDRRLLRVDKTYTGQDQFAIVADLISTAQSATQGNPLGVTVRQHPSPSGVTLTKSYKATDRKCIGDAITELGQSGFEFLESTQRVAGVPSHFLDLWSPMAGNVTNMVWQHGYQCTITGYDVDASKLANRVDAVGGTVAGVKQLGTSTAGLPSTYPLLEGTVSLTDETSTTNLTNQANAEQARRAAPAATGTLTLDALDQFPLYSWQPGDQVWISAHDPNLGLDIDGYHRITGWKADYQNNGTLKVSVDVAAGVPLGKPVRRPVAEFLANQRDLAKRVAVLERSS